MATDPTYIYNPIYGVEPYAALGVPESAQLGGGAQVTQENLLVTMWGNINIPAGFIPTSGDLMKPQTAFGDYLNSVVPELKDLNTEGYKQDFVSRYSARFLIDVKGEQDVAFPLMGVLNPPAALKQRLAGSLEVAPSAAPAGWTVTVKKPITDGSSWGLSAQTIDLDGSFGIDADISGAFGAVFSELPLCATDGSDGVFPTFYQNLLSGSFGGGTLAQMQEFVDAVNSGNFFIPVIFDSSDTDFSVTIEWPHSIGRG